MEGDPPIAMHLTGEGLRVMPYMMEEGDATIAARRLTELLSNRQPAAPAPSESEPADVAGSWLVRTEYVMGSSTHSMVLNQDGEILSGDYRSQFDEVPLSGVVHGDQIELRVVLGYGINRVRYVFTGTVDGDMSGEVSLGEFGKARWRAERMS
jgi:D-glucosaminate-6-phosphate ammonia-lyase